MSVFAESATGWIRFLGTDSSLALASQLLPVAHYIKWISQKPHRNVCVKEACTLQSMESFIPMAMILEISHVRYIVLPALRPYRSLWVALAMNIWARPDSFSYSGNKLMKRVWRSERFAPLNESAGSYVSKRSASAYLKHVYFDDALLRTRVNFWRARGMHPLCFRCRIYPQVIILHA